MSSDVHQGVSAHQSLTSSIYRGMAARVREMLVGREEGQQYLKYRTQVQAASNHRLTCPGSTCTSSPRSTAWGSTRCPPTGWRPTGPGEGGCGVVRVGQVVQYLPQAPLHRVHEGAQALRQDGPAVGRLHGGRGRRGRRRLRHPRPGEGRPEVRARGGGARQEVAGWGEAGLVQDSLCSCLVT